jgi:hypothetical protein
MPYSLGLGHVGYYRVREYDFSQSGRGDHQCLLWSLVAGRWSLVVSLCVHLHTYAYPSLLWNQRIMGDDG